MALLVRCQRWHKAIVGVTIKPSMARFIRTFAAAGGRTAAAAALVCQIRQIEGSRSDFGGNKAQPEQLNQRISQEINTDKVFILIFYSCSNFALRGLLSQLITHIGLFFFQVLRLVDLGFPSKKYQNPLAAQGHCIQDVSSFGSNISLRKSSLDTVPPLPPTGRCRPQQHRPHESDFE